MTENSAIEPQDQPTRADTYTRGIRKTFGTLGLLAGFVVLLLFPDGEAGGGDNLPVKWWVVVGVATVVAAGCWLLAGSGMPGWLARHLTGEELSQPARARPLTHRSARTRSLTRNPAHAKPLMPRWFRPWPRHNAPAGHKPDRGSRAR